MKAAEALSNISVIEDKYLPLEHREDMPRILDLGFDQGLAPEAIEGLSKLVVLPHWYEQGFRLKPIQAWALLNILESRGMLGPIGVGHGKTIIAVRGAADCIQTLGLKRAVYMLPTKVYPQFVKRDIPYIQDRIELYGMKYHLLGQKSVRERHRIAKGKRDGLYVFPYSVLSTTTAEELLHEIDPGAIILDEAHYVKDRRTARTQRLMRFIKEKKPVVVCMSGTLTSKSLMDYHHLAVASLREKCPMPISPSEAMEWCLVLDANASPEPSLSRRLDPLVQWNQDQFKALKPGAIDLTKHRDARHRLAYQYRINTSPGVCYTDSASAVGTSLYITNTPAYIEPKPGEKPHPVLVKARNQPSNTIKAPGWDEMQRLIRRVEDEWVAPNGDDIDFAIHKHKWLRELSSGFYYDLVWPTPDKLALRRGISVRDATQIIERSQEHHAATQEYNKELRRWLESYSRPGIDTPLLVDRAIAREAREVKGDIVKLWKEKKDLEFPDRVKRESKEVRVCPYKIRHAKKWAESHDSGIIWYYHRAIGAWLFDNIPGAILCGGGRQADEAILDSQGRLVLASIRAHSEGKNLQFHKNQLIVESPREALVTEQLLGRVHRAGQEEDELLVHTCLTTDFDHLNYAAMLNDALYITQTTGNSLRAVYAGYEPRPRTFSSSILRQRGFVDIKPLSHSGQQTLKDLFND